MDDPIKVLLIYLYIIDSLRFFFSKEMYMAAINLKEFSRENKFT